MNCWSRLLALAGLCLFSDALIAQPLVLLQENFDNNAVGWPLPNDANQRTAIGGGSLTLERKSGGRSVTAIYPLLNLRQDFSIQATLRNSGPGEGGLLWGGKNEFNALYFTISGNTFRVWETKNGMEASIKAKTVNQSIKPGAGNVLKVARQGNELNCYLNGKLAVTIPLRTLPGTGLGLVALGVTTVACENITVKHSEPQINLAPGVTEGLKKENLGLNINTPQKDLGPVITPDGKTLYFFRFSGQNYNDQEIYFAQRQPDGKWGEARNIGKPLNNESHNMVCSVTPDGNTLLLLNTYHKDGSPGGGGVSMAHRVPGGWSVPEELVIPGFNPRNSTREFALSADGRALLMSIDQEGTQGGKDLWVSLRNAAGNWSPPVNLGPTVNTSSVEECPFLASDGRTLYFNSSGHMGYGKGDIFMTRRLDENWTNWSEPMNLGPAVNSATWDAYYTVPASGESAYCVSEANSFGLTDIFQVKLPEALRPKPVVLLTGRVFNDKTKQPIEADIIYENLADGKEIGRARSSPGTGEYKIVLPAGQTYSYRAQARNYLSAAENLEVKGDAAYSETTKDLFLLPIEAGQKMNLKNIFFQQGKFDLLSSSHPELNRIITMMKERPTMRVLLEGFTDNSGEDTPKGASLNVKLSEDRVASVKSYLISKGIEENRIETKGLGSARPIAPNNNPKTRALNRRVEFTILSE